MNREVDYSASAVPSAMHAFMIDLLDASAESSQRGEAVDLTILLTREQLLEIDRGLGAIENAAKTGQTVALRGSRLEWNVSVRFAIVPKGQELAPLMLKLMLKYDGVLPDESESAEPSGSEPAPELAEDSHPRGPR